VGKKQQSRRELIEKMQRDQARSDRRRTLIIVAASIIVGLAIIAYPAVKLIQDSRTRNQAISDIGASASAASCDAVIEDKASQAQDHQADGAPIKYEQSPPSSGPHYQTWAPFGKTFYSESDRPAIGNLVHNLEHGYTILWYRDTISDEQKGLIERIAKAKLPDGANGKFIAAPFKADDGAAWPDGKNIAFSHWGGGAAGVAKGYRQFCGDLSGEALKDFITKYPSSDAQEPNGG
jgi:hypothetical protein